MSIEVGQTFIDLSRKPYYVRGDGRDSTVPLRQALTDNPGRCLVLPAGLIVTGPLEFAYGTSLIGQGLTTNNSYFYGTTLKADPDKMEGRPLICGNSTRISGYMVQWKLEMLTIDMGWAIGSPAVRISNPGEQALINRCHFHHVDGDAICIDGSSARQMISDCLFAYVRGYFISAVQGIQEIGGKPGASGQIIVAYCSGDDPGKGFIGSNCAHNWAVFAPKMEVPNKSEGVSSITGHFAEFLLAPINGVPAQNAPQPILKIFGGEINLPPGGVVAYVGPTPQSKTKSPDPAYWPANTGLDLRLFWNATCPTSGLLVQDDLHGITVPLKGDGAVPVAWAAPEPT